MFAGTSFQGRDLLREDRIDRSMSSTKLSTKTQQKMKKEFFVEYVFGSAEAKKLVDDFLTTVDHHATIMTEKISEQKQETKNGVQVGETSSHYDAQHANKFIVRQLSRTLADWYGSHDQLVDINQEEIMDLILDCMNTNVNAHLTPRENFHIDQIEDALVELFEKMNDLCVDECEE